MSQSGVSRIFVFSVISLFLLISCASPTPPALPPTETPPPTWTAFPTEALATFTPTPFPTLTPDLELPQYILDLQLNYSTKAAVVHQTINYPNWTGETLTDLVLAVEPNLWSGGFSLKSLTVD